MGTSLMSGARLRMPDVSAQGFSGLILMIIEDSFPFIIGSNCMLKHLDRGKIGAMIRLIRLIVYASLGADKLHNPWHIGLQDMRILSCVNQSPEEEVGDVDRTKHAQVVENILHDAYDMFSS